MGRRLLSAVALLVVAWVAAAVFTAFRASGNEDDATSAAVNALRGTDPPAGNGASCRSALDAGIGLLRARYRCEFFSCFEVTDRLEVTHDVRGRWRFEVTEGGLPGHSKRGWTAPAYSAVSTLDRDSCPEEARGLLQHELEVYVGHVLAGRPAGRHFRRALELSVREIAHARFKPIELLDLEGRRARVRVTSGGKVRRLELRLVGSRWRPVLASG